MVFGAGSPEVQSVHFAQACSLLAFVFTHRWLSETLYEGDDALSTKTVMHYQGMAYLCYYRGVPVNP